MNKNIIQDPTDTVNDMPVVKSLAPTITMKDIARLANVSIGTVDRALHNRGRINEETKKKIMQIADDLNYQGNNVARALSIHNNIRILAIYPAEPVHYMENFSTGFKNELLELSGFGLTLDVLRPRTLEPADFLQITQNLDIEPYDGILINACGSQANTFINNAIRKGKLVATFNSDAPTSHRLFFSGEDHWAAGALSAELIAKMLREKGTVKLFSGSHSVYALQERIRGFTDTIHNDYPDIKILEDYSHEDNMEQRMERAEKFLLSGPIPDAIFCNNAIGAYPVCCMIEKHHISPRPIVVGYDDQALEDMLCRGYCTAMMYQNPSLQAQQALRFMFNCLHDGKPLPSNIESLIMPMIVLKNNYNTI